MKRLRRKHGEVRCLKPLVFILSDRYPVQQSKIELIQYNTLYFPSQHFA